MRYIRSKILNANRIPRFFFRPANYLINKSAVPFSYYSDGFWGIAAVRLKKKQCDPRPLRSCGEGDSSRSAEEWATEGEQTTERLLRYSRLDVHRLGSIGVGPGWHLCNTNKREAHLCG